jgi:hypothetical protein
MTPAGGWLRSFLIEPADPVPDIATGGRRRIIAVVGTLIAGTILLGLLLRVRPGNALFYPLALLQAVLWVVGGLCSGPIRLVQPPADRRSAALAGLFTGVALGGVCTARTQRSRHLSPRRGMRTVSPACATTPDGRARALWTSRLQVPRLDHMNPCLAHGCNESVVESPLRHNLVHDPLCSILAITTCSAQVICEGESRGSV